MVMSEGSSKKLNDYLEAIGRADLIFNCDVIGLEGGLVRLLRNSKFLKWRVRLYYPLTICLRFCSQGKL